MKKVILIADSGATKTDWCLVASNKIIKRIESKGISPIYQSEEIIAKYVSENVFPHFSNTEINAIYFYGSGCIPEKTGIVRNALYANLKVKKIEVYSDLTAAAHALCGEKSGIACILGTGSNSCEWNGQEIVKQISPLGFILGDEGSGAYLGKLLLGNALKNQLPEGMKEKLLEEYNLTVAEIIDNVYRKPFPSRFLASLAPFILKNIKEPKVKAIAERAFNDFFERNVMQYDYQKNEVNFVGSIAFYFKEILQAVANEKNIKIGTIVQSPIDRLVTYYTKIKD